MQLQVVPKFKKLLFGNINTHTLNRLLYLDY